MTTDIGLPARLDRVESRQAIETLIYGYAQAFDRGDRALMRAVWHEDGMLDLGALGTFAGIEAVMEGSEILWASNPRMHHWMANPLIDIDGDVATGATALHAFLTNNDTGPTQVSGLYRDRFARRDGRWGLTERVLDTHFWTPIKDWRPVAGSEAAGA